MEGDTRRRLLQERELERQRQELRQDAERIELEQRERRTEVFRDRLRNERETTRAQAQRVRQERDEERTRTTASLREAARELASQRKAEREVELKRVQLDREARRRAAVGGGSNVDEAYKSALEYDVYVRGKFGTREGFIQQASPSQRDQAEFIFRQVDAGAANDGKVSDPELLLHRVEQMRASTAKLTQRHPDRRWLIVGVVCFFVLAVLYFAM